MSSFLPALADELRAAGLWRGDASALPAALTASAEDAVASRWVLALQIGGAWLSAVFLLLFLGVGVQALIKSATGWLMLGGALTALTGLAIGRLHGPLLRQFLLVASLAGHGALLLGAESFASGSRGGVFLAVALYEAVLLATVAWRAHRLIAAMLTCVALLGAVATWGDALAVRAAFVACWLVAVLLWAGEQRWLGYSCGAALEALALALSLLAIGYALFALTDGYFGFGRPGGMRGAWSQRLLCALSLAGLLWLARGVRGGRMLAGIGVLALALAATWQAPAIAMGAFLLAFGFARGRTALAGLGGVLAVFAVGRYYYDLQATLLVKSALMVGGGALLLAARAFLLVREQEREPSIKVEAGE